MHLIFGDHNWGKQPPNDPKGGAAGWAVQWRNKAGVFKTGLQFATAPGSASHSIESMPDPGDQVRMLKTACLNVRITSSTGGVPK